MPREHRIQIYKTSSGKTPYLSWEAKLSAEVKCGVLAALNKIRRGNMGAVKSLKGKLFEIRIHAGPGYRIYFCKKGECIVLLLCAGTKRSQAKDIERARRLWEEYLQEGED